MTPTVTVPRKGTGFRRHELALLLPILVGVLITGLDTTIVVVGLPGLDAGLGAGLTDTIWVILAYVLVITVCSTPAGRLADHVGKPVVFRAGCGVFLVGSALTAIAWNGSSAITFRALQGIGAAGVTATSGAIGSSLFPRARRGGVYGLIGVAWSFGAMVGIALGGALVTWFSWRLLFVVNIPLCVTAIVLSRQVPGAGKRAAKRSLDIVGVVSLAVALLCFIWAVIHFATDEDGELTTVILAVAILAAVVFVVNERHHADPVVDLRLFSIRIIRGSLFAALFQALGNFAVLFLALLYIQGVMGLSPVTATLLLLPGYLLGGVLCPIGGSLADRFGAVWPASLGLAAEILALVVYATTGTTTSPWVVVGAGLINGFGTGLFVPANNSAVMKAAPLEKLGTCSGLVRTCANIGMVTSLPFAIFAASRAVPPNVSLAVFAGSGRVDPNALLPALHWSFVSLIVVMAVSLLFSVSRSGGVSHRDVATVGRDDGSGDVTGVR